MGYTCGLWSLFHIASVGMLEWNRHADAAKVVVSANEAGETMRDFVSNFFGCEVCRTNFQREYDACALNRCHRLKDAPKEENWREFPLWLLEFHNAVNERLLREKSGEEELSVEEIQRVQWPSRQECSMCWNSVGKLEAENVLKYLRIVYWYVE